MKGRKILQWAVLIGVLLALKPAESIGQSTADLMRKLEQLRAYPELIVINAKISTMNAKLSEFQAMAVKNSRILALGTNDEIRFLAGPKTEVLDAKGRRVLPGLIDAHTHPHLWAPIHWGESQGDFAAKKYNDPQLQILHVTGKEPNELFKNVERAVVQRARELGPGKWIWVHIFGGNSLAEARLLTFPMIQQVSFPRGLITREFLDAVAPQNPVLVQASGILSPSIHNSKAKDEMRKYLGKELDGLDTWNAVWYDILMRGRTEEKVDFVKRELSTCLAAQGITTFGTHYYGAPSIMQTFRLLYESGEMPVRWGWSVGGSHGWNSGIYDPSSKLGYASPDRDYMSEKDLTQALPDLGDFRGIGNDYIWNTGVGYEIFDEGFMCTTAKTLPNAVMRGGYLEPLDCAKAPNVPGRYTLGANSQLTAGERNTPGAGVDLPSSSTPVPSKQATWDYENDPALQMYRNVRTALQSGLRVAVMHTVTDGSWDVFLHVLDELIAKQELTLEQVRAARIMTEHNPIIRPDQVAKIAYYGIRPNLAMRPYFAAAFIQKTGEQYVNWVEPMKGLADAGVHPAFSTDAHMINEPPDFEPIDREGDSVWGELEFYLTRTTPKEKADRQAQVGVAVVPPSPNQAVDKVTLMKSATIWGAEGLLNEKNIGSLEVGKLADFIVLDKDYFAVPEDQVHTINTLLTAVGGKIEFKSPSY